MGLAEFALISRKWKPATLLHKTTNQYPSLLEYIPADVLDSRLDTLSTLVSSKYPKIWIDTYLFFLAIFFVLFAAAFAIGLQATASHRDKLWYPLLILIAPVFIAFWTSRRRVTHYERLKNFNDLLQKCLKEFNSVDTTRHTKWQYRRLRDDDTVESLGLMGPISQWQIVLIIEVIQIDPEDAHHMGNEVDMVLPSYYAAVQDVVLDMGPLDRTQRHPLEEQDLGVDQQQQQQSVGLSYPLPPEYNNNNTGSQPRQEMEIALPATSSPPTYHR